jgi:cardiolipin synthase
LPNKQIYIQSPYFIPDQAFLDSIKIAALGGVEVNIMTPNMPDHPFVYWATLKNVASLLEAGVNVYPPPSAAILIESKKAWSGMK